MLARWHRNKTHGIRKLAPTQKDGRVLCKVIFQTQLGYNSTARYGVCYWSCQQTMNAHFETLPSESHVGVCLYGILFPHLFLHTYIYCLYAHLLPYEIKTPSPITASCMVYALPTCISIRLNGFTFKITVWMHALMYSISTARSIEEEVHWKNTIINKIWVQPHKELTTLSVQNFNVRLRFILVFPTISPSKVNSFHIGTLSSNINISNQS